MLFTIRKTSEPDAYNKRPPHPKAVWVREDGTTDVWDKDDTDIVETECGYWQIDIGTAEELAAIASRVIIDSGKNHRFGPESPACSLPEIEIYDQWRE